MKIKEKFLLKIALFFLLIMQVSLSYGTDIRKGIMKELEGIFLTIEENYAPLKVKEDLVGLKWEATKNKYRQEILKVSNTRDYYFMLSRLFAELKDAHVSFILNSSYTKYIPSIQFDLVEGKTIVNYFDPGAEEEEGSEEDSEKEDTDGDKTSDEEVSQREELPACEAQVGDELVKFDGLTPVELRKELSKYVNVGMPKSNDRLITLHYLTMRREQRGVPVPFKKDQVATFLLKKHDSEKLYECRFYWEEKGTTFPSRNFDGTDDRSLIADVSDFTSFGQGEPRSNQGPRTLRERIWQVLSPLVTLTHKRWSDFQSFFTSSSEGPSENAKGKRLFVGNPDTFIALPENFVSLEPSYGLSEFLNPYNYIAGKFEYKGLNVGFLRIPSYVPKEPVMVNIMFSLYAIRYYIGILEEQTDLLIIDQTFNPGGLVLQVDWLVEALGGKVGPDTSVTFNMRVTQGLLNQEKQLMHMFFDEKEGMVSQMDMDEEFVEGMKKRFIERYHNLESDYQKHNKLSEKYHLSLASEFLKPIWGDYDSLGIIGTIAKGLSWLINFLLGVDITVDHVYTKPIFVHTNELNFSGGDVFPATIKDNKLGLIFGEKTAGAGGHVLGFSNILMHNFDFSMTASLIRRIDGKLIENIGVTPDVSFGPTVDDYKNDFKDYLQRMLDKVVWPNLPEELTQIDEE